MKSNSIALVILALVSAVPAMAETATWTARKVNLSYTPFNGAVSCDYVQREAEAVLKQLGAREISFNCMGGLPDTASVNMDITFKSAAIGGGAHSEPAAFHELKLAGSEECDMHQNVIRQLLPSFTTQKIVDSSSCWDSQGEYSFSLSVLK